MRSPNISKRQLGAWLFAALSGPVAQFAGGVSWQTALMTAAVCLGVSFLAGNIYIRPGKWLSLIECLWLVYTLASLGQWIGGSWKSGNVYPAIPLILLALGAAAAGKGVEVAARAGSAVFWLLALIYSGMIAAGIGQVDLRELAVFDGEPDSRLVTVLLIPALTVFLAEDERKCPVGALAGIGAFAVLMSALITGTRSLLVAKESSMPLFDWAENLSLAGTLRRFESLVSVALTMGWFALLTMLLSVGGHLTECVKKGQYSAGVWTLAAASGIVMLIKVPILQEITTIGSVLMWIIVPCLESRRDKNKKFKKSENNA